MRPRLAFGEFVLEPALQRLTRGGAIVRLKPKPYDLLCLLLDNCERVVGKQELLDWLWPRQDVYEANLSQTVYELRRALGDDARGGRWIENVPRRGYRFAGQVEVLATPRVTDGPPASLAVLPLRPLAGSPTTAHLGVGIADAVITALARSGQLVVRPTSAILRYLHMDQDALEAGGDLQVEAVLEGTIQQVGDVLRVSARLLQVADGRALWADTYTLVPGEVFAIQDRISTQVARAVALRLTAQEQRHMSRRHTEDIEVYGLYMQGRYCWQQWTPDAWWRAVAFFRQAIERQADHAPSHAGLASALSTLGIFGSLPPREAFSQARVAAARSVESDAERPEGHEILGAIALFHDWDTAAALGHLDDAIERAPDSSNARHLRAMALATGGHDALALAEIHHAVHADPQSLIARTDVGFVHYWARRHDQALAALEAATRLDPQFGHARIKMAPVLLALGRPDEALAQVDRGLLLSGRDPMLSGERAYVLAHCGSRSQATAILDALQAASCRGYVDPYGIVLAQLGLGDHDAVFEALERALANRSRDLMLMRVDPVIDPLRSDPRFAEFMAKAGLGQP